MILKKIILLSTIFFIFCIHSMHQQPDLTALLTHCTQLQNVLIFHDEEVFSTTHLENTATIEELTHLKFLLEHINDYRNIDFSEWQNFIRDNNTLCKQTYKTMTTLSIMSFMLALIISGSLHGQFDIDTKLSLVDENLFCITILGIIFALFTNKFVEKFDDFYSLRKDIQKLLLTISKHEE